MTRDQDPRLSRAAAVGHDFAGEAVHLGDVIRHRLTNRDFTVLSADEEGINVSGPDGRRRTIHPRGLERGYGKVTR